MTGIYYSKFENPRKFKIGDIVIIETRQLRPCMAEIVGYDQYHRDIYILSIIDDEERKFENAISSSDDIDNMDRFFGTYHAYEHCLELVEEAD